MLHSAVSIHDSNPRFRWRTRAHISSSILYLLFALLSAMGGIHPVHAQIQYMYDEAGRLVGVVAPNGQTAQYSYDSTGNITRVQRLGIADLSLMEFLPNAGTPGSEVVLWGTGFAPGPAENVVRFNGAQGVVLTASAHRLVVRVPHDASTGRITVKTPRESVTSAGEFVVVSSAQAPSINAFSPALGEVGQTVSVTGINFPTAVLENRLRFNMTSAAVTDATSQSLLTAVPSGATSGPLILRTPRGSTESDADFFAVPTDRKAGDIGFIGRLEADRPDVVVRLAANQSALLVLRGVQGQRRLLVVSPNTFAAAFTLTMLSPSGKTLLRTTVTGTDTIVLPVLPASGAYTLRLDAPSTAGSVTLALKATAALEVDGSTLELTTAKAGENALVTFTGRAGQWLGLSLDIALAGVGGGPVFINIYRPDGSRLQTTAPSSCDGGFVSGANRCALRNLPAEGTYSIRVAPQGASAAAMKLTLSSDLLLTTEPNGEAATFTARRPGQNAHHTFAGVSGQYISAALLNNLLAGYTQVYLFAPGGEAVGGSRSVARDGSVEFNALPVTGNYTLWIGPSAGAQGETRVQLLTDNINDITIDGSTVGASLLPGQNARFTFTGGAGQNVSLGMTQQMGAGAVASADVSIAKSDGGFMHNTWPADCKRIWAAADRCTLMNLPANGGYTILVDPKGTLPTQLALTLSTLATTSLQINGPATVARSNRPGQSALIQFDVDSRKTVRLNWKANTLSAGRLYLYRADRLLLGQRNINNASAASGIWDLGLLNPGRHVVWIDPGTSPPGETTVFLTSP